MRAKKYKKERGGAFLLKAPPRVKLLCYPAVCWLQAILMTQSPLCNCAFGARQKTIEAYTEGNGVTSITRPITLNESSSPSGISR